VQPKARLLDVAQQRDNVRPDNVVSKAKSVLALVNSAMRSSTVRPARNKPASGSKGDKPRAIKSALMKLRPLAWSGRNSVASVVFPAPFGPAIM